MNITVGSKVTTGVYVCGKFVAMQTGCLVKSISDDSSVAQIDIAAGTGCGAIMRNEAISHLRLDIPECDCSASDMHFLRCCKAK